jgi:hypothetical protein
MEDFYFYSIVVAIVVLICVLTVIGLSITKGNLAKKFPPVENECPDYWEQGTADSLPSGTISGNASPSNYCKYPANINQGDTSFSATMTTGGQEWNTTSTNFGGAAVPDGNGKTNYYVKFRGNDASWNTIYPGLSLRCAKRKWAKDRGIIWDGVTNYNGCEAKK